MNALWNSQEGKRLSLCFILLLLLSCCVQAAETGAQAKPEIQKVRAGSSASAILHIRGDDSYPPYEYRNQQGQPEGFNVDIINAIAHAMGLQITIDLGSWDDVRRQLGGGQIDALMGMFNTAERDKTFDFSIPHFIASYAVFVRTDSEIHSLNEAQDAAIIVQLSDLGHDYIVEQHVTEQIITKRDMTAVLQALARGEGDCAVVSRLQGVQLINKLGLSNVKPVGPPIIQRKYCLAVKEGNSSLLAKLNEGLSIIKETGEYDAIYRKWFGVYEEQVNVVAYTVKRMILIVLPLLLLALFGFLWSWTLKKRVRSQTNDLRSRIVEQQRTEEALRVSNELLSLFIRHSPIYAFIKEVTPAESRVLTASENYRDMVGIPGSEMAGKTMHELFPEEFARKMTADDWHVVSQGKTILLDEKLNDRRYTTIKFPINLGERHLLAGYTIDVTERIQTEEELRKHENQLRKIFEILPIGLWFTDKNGNLLRGNPMGMRIWGVKQDMPLPAYKDFKVCIQPSGEQIAPEDMALTRTLHQGVTVMDELLEITAFDGQRKVILNYTTPLFDDNGNIDGAIMVNLDITDRQNLELQLLQSQKMESIGRLAGGVAHDFNNMLSVILGHAELLLGRLSTDDHLYAGLRSIQQAAEQSANLTRQLLAFARKQTVAPKVLDLNDVVAGMLNILQRLIGEDIELVWRAGPNLGLVKIDPTQIEQILINLCVNARDAITDTGKITLETLAVSFDQKCCARHRGAKTGIYTMLAVSDNGCGIEPEILPHIYEPFYTTKEQGVGTGLGLAMVYGIIKQNDGFIDAYSEQRLGTTFKMYLPTIKEEMEPKAEEQTDHVVTGNETVLLVEDDPMLLQLSKEMLEKLGYTVIAVATQETAIEHAQNERSGPGHQAARTSAGSTCVVYVWLYCQCHRPSRCPGKGCAVHSETLFAFAVFPKDPGSVAGESGIFQHRQRLIWRTTGGTCLKQEDFCTIQTRVDTSSRDEPEIMNRPLLISNRLSTGIVRSIPIIRGEIRVFQYRPFPGLRR